MYQGLKYEITVRNLPDAAEEFAALKELANQERDIRNKIRVKFEASPLHTYLEGFVSMGLPKGERESCLRFDSGRVSVSISESSLRKDYFNPQPQQHIPPFAYVGEKTLNMLLGGKLLTNEEKRHIVKQLKVIADEPSRDSDNA